MFKYKLFAIACVAVIAGILAFQCARKLAEANPMSAELAAAITQARGSLAHFRTKLESGQDRAYFVRGSFKEPDGRMDMLWVKRVVAKPDGFTGTVDQEPTMVKTVHKGEEVTLKAADVIDWMIIHQDDTREGGFTEGKEPRR
jgi:uncharacterized protein YegJ (DUF2314 family)